MTILITGASGFIGKALCERLLADGYKVRGAVLDVAQMLALPVGVEGAIVGNISLKTDWTEALAGIDCIVHLAARVHVMNDTSADPLAAFREVNVAGTERLAHQAAETGVKRLVFLSSVKVHGEETDVPYSEENRPSPQDPYGVSKLEAENVLRIVSERTGLEIAVLRPSLVYGPGVKANFLYLLRLVEKRFPLPFARINNRRSLVYLGNLIDAIIICAIHPNASGKTYLVSDGEDVSTPELIRKVAAALGRQASLFPFPPSFMRFLGRISGKSDAVGRLVSSLTIDSSRIRRELNWTPPFTMAQGLKKTAEWYKKSNSC